MARGDTSIEVVAVSYHQDNILKTLINSVKAQVLPVVHHDGAESDGFLSYDENFRAYPNWKLHIIHDGNDEFYRRMKDDLEKNGYLDDRVTYTCSEKRCDDGYGHGNRHAGLMNLVSKDSDYALVVNGDTIFAPTLFRWIDSVHRLHNPDLIYWDIVHRAIQQTHNQGGMSSHLLPGHIDWVSVAIRTEIAKAGSKPWDELDGDWQWIAECCGITGESPSPKISTFKLGKILTMHN